MIRYNALPQGFRIHRRFLVEELVGQGRSSAVYRALDLDTRSLVALKVLDPFLARDPTSLERFAREVKIIRALDHPNVVRLYGFLKDQGFYVISMEYIDGIDCGAYVRRHGHLDLAEFLPIARTVTSAVGSCHKAGVLHRDLKPQNILLTAAKDVKLVDFGVSKVSTMSDLTKTGTVIGTPEYMAPEQFTSTTADPRSDVYSLGAVFYELLTERPPYAGTSLSSILGRQLRQDLEPVSSLRPEVPEWLDAVVRKCLRTDRSNRYQSCFELAEDLGKGERSLARWEEKREPVLCLSCKTPQIAGLPFCHLCGTFASEVYERGRHSLILYQCDEPDAVSAHLARVLPAGDEGAIRARLDNLPVLLLRGVSRNTAAALASDLAPYPCELKISDKLPRQLRLPGKYLFYGCLALAPMVIWNSLSFSLRLWVIVASEALVIYLYRRRIRPLVKLGALKPRAKVKADPFSLEAARRLRRMKAEDLKTIVGKIAHSFLAIRAATGAAAAGVDRKALSRLIEKALRAAETVEGYELYLSSRSLNGIKQKLDAAEHRLEQASDPQQMEPLIEAKTKLRSDFERYQEVQELHSRLFVGLLNLNSTLKALADALAERKSAAAAAAEIAALEGDLTLGDSDPGAGRRRAL